MKSPSIVVCEQVACSTANTASRFHLTVPKSKPGSFSGAAGEQCARYFPNLRFGERENRIIVVWAGGRRDQKTTGPLSLAADTVVSEQHGRGGSERASVIAHTQLELRPFPRPARVLSRSLVCVCISIFSRERTRNLMPRLRRRCSFWRVIFQAVTFAAADHSGASMELHLQ
jgi:hypothetical protein